RLGLRRLSLDLELAECQLELLADPIERRVRAGGDGRSDIFEREAERARFERRQPGRAAEGVAEQLLLDAHLVSLQLRVDGVAATAEVDEVEELEVLLELLLGNVEAVDQVARRDRRS